MTKIYVYSDAEKAELDAFDANVLGTEASRKWFDEGEGKSIKHRLKRHYMLEQRLMCCYCRKGRSNTHLAHWELEHVLATDIYPDFHRIPLNLAIACSKCNGIKKKHDVLSPNVGRPVSKLPETPDAYTIPHPNLANWDEHLGHVNFLVYWHKSPKGEQLKIICGLNASAEEALGLPEGAARVAEEQRLFQKFAPRLPAGATVADAVEHAHQALEILEQPHRDLSLRRLAATLEKPWRKRQPRNVKTLVDS